MKYIMLITYSFDSDYIAVPCETEAEAKELLEKYLKEEVLTVKNESEYEPIVRHHSESEVELVYEESEVYVDSDTDYAVYKIIEVGHGVNGSRFKYLENEMDV